MGYFKVGANNAAFCLNEEALNACRFALFGKLPEQKKYYYNTASAERLMGISEPSMRHLAQQIQEAYHQRRDYQRVLEVTATLGDKTHTARFRLNYDVLFCSGATETITAPSGRSMHITKPSLVFTSEGLQKLHQLAHGSTETAAKQWWGDVNNPDKFYQVKSPYWMNKQEVMHTLNIHLDQSVVGRAFDQLWKQLETAHRSAFNQGEIAGARLKLEITA